MFKTQINKRETVKRIQTRMKIDKKKKIMQTTENKLIHDMKVCAKTSPFVKFAPLEFNHL